MKKNYSLGIKPFRSKNVIPRKYGRIWNALILAGLFVGAGFQSSAQGDIQIEAETSDRVTLANECEPIGSFVEDFDTTEEGNVPDCFQSIMLYASGGYANMEVLSIPNANSLPNVFKFYNGDDTNAEMYLISPELNNLADADHRLRFYFDGAHTVNLEIGTMTDPASISTYSTMEMLSTSSTFNEYIVDFNEGFNDNYLVFKVSYSADYYSVYLDDINWEPIPVACPKPHDVTIDSVEETTVNVSWIAGAEETEWEVIYGETGFDVESEGALEVVEVEQITLTNLAEDRTYDVYVRGVCGEEDFSTWAGPKSFTIENLGVADVLFEGFTYYPNPVNSKLTLNAAFVIEQAEVYTILGQSVLEITPNATTADLDLTNLQAGTYLLQIKIDGVIKTIKLLKE